MRKLLLSVAVALVCLVVASSASAALHTGSATGPLVANGTTLTFTNSGNVTWQSSFFGTTYTCANATMRITSSNYAATPVAFDIQQFDMTNCTSGCGTATITTSGTPWMGAASLATTTSPNGTYKFATPGQNWTLVACGLTCSYGTSSSGVSAPFNGANPAWFTENSNITNSSCFDTATWHGTFTSAGPLGNGLYTS